MHDLQMKYKEEIASLSSASKRLSHLGYVASHGGNLSQRVDNNVFIITPTKVAKHSVEFNDVCIVDSEGKTLYAAEGRKPTGETPLHLHIFEKRPDVQSVIHSHAPVLTGFAIAHSDLLEQAVLPEPILELGPVLSIAYEEPLTEKLACAIDAVIDKTNAFLMWNHGVIVMSNEGVERTLDLTEMLENMAVSIIVAQSLGSVKTISEEEIKNLDNVNKVRGLPFPGKPGLISSYLHAYRTK